jgi:hypothetical protein
VLYCACATNHGYQWHGHVAVMAEDGNGVYREYIR